MRIFKFIKEHLLLILAIVLGSGLFIYMLTNIEIKREPEFYLNGKPYYTQVKCVESKSERVYEYHYGYSTVRGRYCWHWGYNTKFKCI